MRNTLLAVEWAEGARGVCHEQSTDKATEACARVCVCVCVSVCLRTRAISQCQPKCKIA